MDGTNNSSSGGRETESVGVQGAGSVCKVALATTTDRPATGGAGGAVGA